MQQNVNQMLKRKYSKTWTKCPKEKKKKMHLQIVIKFWEHHAF